MLSSLPVLVLVSLLFVYSVFVAYGAYERAAQAEAHVDDVRAELYDLEARAIEIDTELNKLGTQRGVEEELREKYNVGREGEQAILLVE